MKVVVLACRRACETVTPPPAGWGVAIRRLAGDRRSGQLRLIASGDNHIAAGAGSEQRSATWDGQIGSAATTDW